MNRAQTVSRNPDAPERQQSALGSVLFPLGFGSLLLCIGVCIPPWVELLGERFCGLAGEGKIIASFSALLAVLLCVFHSGPRQTLVHSFAAAWGTLSAAWLAYLLWQLSHDPQLTLLITWWLPLAVLLSLTAGICFTTIVLLRQRRPAIQRTAVNASAKETSSDVKPQPPRPLRALLIAYLIVFWIGGNIVLLRGDSLRLHARVDNSLVRPRGR